MAEAHAVIQMAMDRKGGLPEDVVVHTWHYQAEDAGVGSDSASIFDDNIGGVLDRLETFYDVMASYWSAALAGTGLLKAYLWDEDPPRVPRETRSTTFGTLADSMPTEVALCLSMEADIASGQKAGRRRGRVYLGPFGRNMSTYTSGASDGRPSSTDIGAILTAAEDVAQASSPEGFKLAVFSPTEIATGGSVSDAWNVVHKIWMDNAWDIQRRRGARATARDERDVN